MKQNLNQGLLRYINMRKLFKGGNYSKAETIRGNTVFESVNYAKAAAVIQVVSMGAMG